MVEGPLYYLTASETRGNESVEWGATSSIREGSCPGQGALTDTDSLNTTPHTHHSFCIHVFKTHSQHTGLPPESHRTRTS